MIGNERSLDVILGKNKIATFLLKNDQLVWRYNEKWQLSGYPVSPHLALQGDIPSLHVQRFLSNLLPERQVSVAGVQDKINVVLNEKGELGFGEGSFCSTLTCQQ